MSQDNLISKYAAGEYLKAEDVTSEDQAYAVVNISEEKYMDRDTLVFHLQYNDGINVKFNVNRTNAKTLRDKFNVMGANDIVGKKVYFKKIMVNNPTTKQPQDSLIIYKVE